MSILPEYILRTILFHGVRELRKNLKIVDQLLWNVNIDDVDKVKKTVTDVGINIVLQYPKQDTAVPFVAIILGKENEDNPVLGDNLGSGVVAPADMSYGNISDLAVMGQATPGGTLLAQPKKIYKEGQLIERIGGGFRTEYQLLIGTENQDLTIFLYVFLKSILFKYKPLLEDNGMLNFTMSGTEIGYSKDFVPEFVYTRTLKAAFDYFFEVFVEMGVLESLDTEVSVAGDSLSDVVDVLGPVVV